jgi:hypothetical protein
MQAQMQVRLHAPHLVFTRPSSLLPSPLPVRKRSLHATETCVQRAPAAAADRRGQAIRRPDPKDARGGWCPRRWLACHPRSCPCSNLQSLPSALRSDAHACRARPCSLPRVWRDSRNRDLARSTNQYASGSLFSPRAPPKLPVPLPAVPSHLRSTGRRAAMAVLPDVRRVAPCRAAASSSTTA